MFRKYIFLAFKTKLDTRNEIRSKNVFILLKLINKTIFDTFTNVVQILQIT